MTTGTAPRGGDAPLIVWDFDGTVADSTARAWDVTKGVYEEITTRPSSDCDALLDLAAHRQAAGASTNWRELFGRSLGIPDSDVDRAGERWAQLYNASETAVEPSPGLESLLTESGPSIHAIVSQGSTKRIRRWLIEHGLESCFFQVVGADNLPRDYQKPAGEALKAVVDCLGGSPP